MLFSSINQLLLRWCSGVIVWGVVGCICSKYDKIYPIDLSLSFFRKKKKGKKNDDVSYLFVVNLDF